MNGYVIAGYSITFAVLAGYAFRVIGRGRALSRALQAGDSVNPNRQWK